MIPSTPRKASRPTPIKEHETVGVAVNGVALVGGDIKTLSFDDCLGHTDTDHHYHYHMAPKCLFEDLGIPYPCNATWWHRKNRAKYWPQTGPASPLVGWALDGFPIYGPYDQDGKLTRSKDLDACNGREVDGNYQYVMTPEPPFIMGCFTGTPGAAEATMMAEPEACPRGGVQNTVHPVAHNFQLQLPTCPRFDPIPEMKEREREPVTASNAFALGSDMSATYMLSEDGESIDFTVVGGAYWVSMGVSIDGTMTGGGEGSDIYICSDLGIVNRHFVTEKSMPVDGVAVAGASCTRIDGQTTMMFTRKLADPDVASLPITGATTYIYAHGSSTDLSYHRGSRGAVAFDVITGATGEIIELAAPASLWAHMLLMTGAWGLLLPLGVAMARYQRLHPTPGYWFTLHKRFQYSGWVLSLAGLVAIVMYLNNAKQAHFSGPFVAHMGIGILVVLLGFVQPFIAMVRPHANAPEDKPTCNKRTIWEYTHKGIGYTAVFLGPINVCYGVYVAFAKGLVSAFRVASLSLCLIFLVPLVAYVVYKQVTGGKQVAVVAKGTEEEELKAAV